jgi:hypothetical protein
MTTATYTKLQSGNWGVRVRGEIEAGDRITVTKKDGTTKVETIERVLWTGNGVSLCAINQRPAHTNYRGSGGSSIERLYRNKYGWDGVRGSASYYSSGMYDEES